MIKVLFIFDIAGVGATIAEYINSKGHGKSYVVFRKQYDKMCLTSKFDYNIVPSCSTKRWVLIVIKHLLFFRPDVVHINSWKKGLILVRIFRSKAKVVMQFHGTDIRGKRIPRYVKALSDKILVSTKDLVNKDTTYMGVPLE